MENTPQENISAVKHNKNKLTYKDVLIIVLSIALIGVIAFTLVTSIFSQCDEFVPASVPIDNQGDADDISELPPSIPVSQLKAYAAQYNVSAEFLQRFFDDVIVYKNNDGIVYLPIDESLPKSDYVWNNLAYLDKEIQYQVDGEVQSIKGIDVSKYQGNINWKKVANDGVEFAFVRIGVRGYGESGKIVEDDTWRKNIEGSINNGIDTGAYFYSQAISVEEAIEEANFVLERIKGYDLTYPVVFDFEEVTEDGSRTANLTPAERTDITIAFCEKIKEAGYQTMVYGNIKWFVEMLDLSRLTQYDKWFAQYFKTPFFPYDFQMWQYTGRGSVDGIEGDVDMNIGFKDYNPDPADNSTSSDVSSPQ